MTKNVSQNVEEVIILWEAPKVEKPEFRLYYDDAGKVITYTCEKLIGKYIVIDAATFAEAKPDVRVIDGKITNTSKVSYISKLKPCDKEGTICASDDVSIVLEKHSKKAQLWRLRLNEF